jgi:hypothetical protein
MRQRESGGVTFLERRLAVLRALVALVVLGAALARGAPTSRAGRHSPASGA